MKFLDFRHKKWANLGLFKALKTKFWILLWWINFCHVSTFLKMFDINQYPAYIKKFVKCNLRPISYLPPSATNCQYLFHNVWWHNKQNGHEIDPQQVTAIFFSGEKTGSGNSGKNPNTKFQTFEVCFGNSTTKCTDLCKIFKVSFWF